MTALLQLLEAIFGWLLAASWQASALALVVLLIQAIAGARLNPRWRYALWLLVLIRLVLPVLPESALSLFQFAPPPPPALTDTVTEPLFVSAALPSPSLETEISPPVYPFSFFSLLAVIWLAGAIGLFVLTWQVNRRFARQVANSPPIDDPALLALFAEAHRELGLRRTIRLIENSQVQSPAIMGLFQPTLLLPGDVRAKFNEQELRFIFLHELAHLKRGDILVQALIALLQILHWFNPVLWFAFRRMRIDREPATDALVLSRTGEQEKERYGQMLIKLLEHFNQRHSLPTLVGILEDKDQFKRRFSLIARFTRGAYGWSLLGVLLIGALAVACLTKAKAIENPETAASSDSVYLKMSVLEMDERNYQAHRDQLDALEQKGDVTTFAQVSAAKFVARPGVSSSYGKLMVLETGAPNSSPILNGVADIQNSILILKLTANPNGGKIALNGSLNMDAVASDDRPGNTPARPTLDTKEISVNEEMLPGETKAIEAPADAKSSDRYFIFLTAASGPPRLTTAATNSTTVATPSPPSDAIAPDSDLATRKKQLLEAKEDADARQVLYDKVKDLPDDQFIDVLTALGRSSPKITAFQNDIALKNAQIEGLTKKGLAEANPQIQTLQAEVDSEQQKLKDLIAGFRHAMGVDLDMANSRVTFLTDEVNNLKSQKEAAPPTSSNASSPVAQLPHGKMIKIGIKVLEVNNYDYLANKKEMDAAVEKADIGYFNNRKVISMLSTPSVSTLPGLKANVDIVREYSYPTSFENVQAVSTGPGATVIVPPTPKEFATKNVGISAEITPSIDNGNTPDHGKIILNGKFTCTNFEGFTQSNLAIAGQPSFSISESLFLEALNDNEEKGVWIPGEHVGDINNSAQPPGHVADANLVKKRYLLFLNAKLVD
jgi:beta-lactamase regulating signal transducer with metallopeptidase domain